MLSRFPPARDFRSLSVEDLLIARDDFHAHLLHLDTVVGTAVGLYRIRAKDEDATKPINGHVMLRQREEQYAGKETPTKAPARTLANSVVKPWSWPCILVFVSEWRDPVEFAHRPDTVIPPFLYARDGLVVPTCTILAERVDEPDLEPGEVPALRATPASLVGGGYPLFVTRQGAVHAGSVGCLVRDGRATYALTNQHVAGDTGTRVRSLLRGTSVEIGTTHARQRGKVKFTDAYPGWPGTRCFSTIDAGLIELDYCADWTAQINQLGEVGQLVDLNTETITLDLIGCPVRAFGAASGTLSGQIHGLFYRYRSVGGFDYVADLLIGPRAQTTSKSKSEDKTDEPAFAVEVKPATATLPGDSGTVWVWDVPPDDKADGPDDVDGVRVNRPLALQWGAHTLIEGGKKQRFRFALATSLSTICRMLDVEVVRDLNAGQTETWGVFGHYKIASTACDLVTDAQLRTLLQNNRSRIAFGDDDLIGGDADGLKSNQFVPLADVADIVWRFTRKKDEANHFADMDQPGGAAFGGRTLMELFDADATSLAEATWTEFYDSVEDLTGEQIADKHRGALPFRVKQIYLDMVSFAAEGKVAEFVAAAGLVAHYAGDACQPLHVSRLHHGEPGAGEAAVHSDYETKMITRKVDELLPKVSAAAKAVNPAKCFEGGRSAAEHMVAVMKKATAKLSPERVVQAWRDAKANAVHGRSFLEDLWHDVGSDTVAVMTIGAEGLALLWESAWREGRKGKPALQPNALKAVSKTKLMSLYNDDHFLHSEFLRNMKVGAAAAVGDALGVGD